MRLLASEGDPIAYPFPFFNYLIRGHAHHMEAGGMRPTILGIVILPFVLRVWYIDFLDLSSCGSFVAVLRTVWLCGTFVNYLESLAN